MIFLNKTYGSSKILFASNQGYPHYMLFGENMVGSDRLVISSYMVPLLIISGHYDVISKELKKLLISRFSVFECFFRSKNALIVIRSKNAEK